MTSLRKAPTKCPAPGDDLPDPPITAVKDNSAAGRLLSEETMAFDTSQPALIEHSLDNGEHTPSSGMPVLQPMEPYPLDASLHSEPFKPIRCLVRPNQREAGCLLTRTHLAQACRRGFAALLPSVDLLPRPKYSVGKLICKLGVPRTSWSTMSGETEVEIPSTPLHSTPKSAYAALSMVVSELPG